MKNGYFDDDKQEYVITNPDTPMSWINYLGTEDYGALISNNAAGYSFYKSAKSRRMLRFRFNSIPMDRPGRYIYIRDDVDGDYWSASWQPVGKNLEEYQNECRHGLGYTKFISDYKGITSNYRVFVPIDKPIELWEINLENNSDRTRELSIFSYGEWCFWYMEQDLKNFQYILYTCDMDYEDDIIDYSIKLWPPEKPKAFMASVLPAVSYDTDRKEFIGRYNSESNPRAVVRGECSNSIAVGGNPCAALQNKVVLKPGEQKRALFIVGMGEAREEGRKYKELYSSVDEVDREFAKVKQYWRKRLGGFSCNTPSAELNSMVNIWNQYQCHTTFNWSRSASFNEAGGRDGLGFRDTNQDTLGVVHIIPEKVRQKIVELLKGQLQEGYALHGIQPLEWEQGEHNIPSEEDIFSDDHLWLLVSTAAYLKETGNMNFLQEVIPYADTGEDTVYEHLKKALEFSYGQRGPHGLLLGLAADWNDCINLKGSGESIWTTFLYYRGLQEFIAMAERIGNQEDVTRFQGIKEEMEELLTEYAWDGEWFLRGYLDSGRKLGSRQSDQAKIFLNAQTWAVVSGFDRGEKAVQAMDKVEEYLATPYGNVLNYPAFSEIDEEVGAATSFPPGLKENGGIFCHANTWSIIAEAVLGRGDKAFKYYMSYLPAARNDDAEEYTMEPYVYSQFITGKEHPHYFGRARNSWLTGTAAWSFWAVTNYILGLRADYEGLIVDPCIPAHWDNFSVTRNYRGCKLEISFENPDNVNRGVHRLILNGQEISGNVVTDDNLKEENSLRVVMG